MDLPRAMTGLGASEIASLTVNGYDWMTAMYNIHTQGPVLYRYSMTDLKSIFRWACSGSASGSCSGAENLRFNKPATPVYYPPNGGPLRLTAGNTDLASAACKALLGVDGAGNCRVPNDQKAAKFRQDGIDHGIDY